VADYAQDTQDITVDVAAYDLPVRCYLVTKVTLTDSDGETTDSDALTFERTSDPDAEGYFLLAGQAVIYPTPTESVVDALNIYYIETPVEVRGSTNVPYSADFEDAMIEWVVVKCKARQEEKVADFAAVHALIQQTLDALVVQTNSPNDEAGLHVSWRDWV